METAEITSRYAAAGFTNASGFTEKHFLDDDGLTTLIIQPDRTRGSTTYDDNRQVLSRTDALGRTETFEYDADGQVTQRIRHLCWDGRMFSNDVMIKPQTWNDILAAMIAVRDGHGWEE